MKYFWTGRSGIASTGVRKPQIAMTTMRMDVTAREIVSELEWAAWNFLFLLPI
jgi:hypothetical protein